VYIVFFSGCPIVWSSRLQTEIALSTTEAEYIALSQATREVIPLMNTLKEISRIFVFSVRTPTVLCSLFEDNNSCIAIAKALRMSPRTKHTAMKYHHFRHKVISGEINILPIHMKDRISDLLTKPRCVQSFVVGNLFASF